MSDTPLEAVAGWTAQHLSRMKAAWITTAEQLVALSATDDGLRSISEQLQVSQGEAKRLVELARSALAPDVRAQMEERVDTSNYGLGARRPSDDTKR